MKRYNALLSFKASCALRTLKNTISRLFCLSAAGAALFGCAGAPPEGEPAETLGEPLQQPSLMEARFFSVNSDQTITLLREQNYSRNWYRILPLELGQPFTSLLFYDRVANSAKLYHTTGNGVLSLVSTYSNWNQWDEVVPVRLNFAEQGLFFYDRTSSGTRLGRLYGVDSSGTLTHMGDQDLSESTNPRGFDAIVAGYFATAPSTGTQDILGYNKDSGELATLVRGSAGMTIQAHTSVGSHWDQMVAGNFAGDSRTDVILYDRDSGTSVLMVNSSGTFTAQTERTTWPMAEHRVFVAGDFGGDSFTDLLVYDGRNDNPTVNGQGKFYVNDGTGAFTNASKIHSDWRKTWATIVPGRFDGVARDDILFYENTYYLKLTIVQPQSGNTTRTVSDAKVSEWVNGFNRVYATAGLHINEFEKVTVSGNQHLFDGYCGIADEGAYVSQINTWIAANKPNNLVVVLPPNNGSAACSDPAKRFAWAQNTADEGLLVHELGHYLSLPHAFHQETHKDMKAFFGCGESINRIAADKRLGADVTTLAELDRDFTQASFSSIPDTGADPGPYYFAAAGIDRCTYDGSKAKVVARNSSGTGLYSNNPEPKNVMSYSLKPGFPSCPIDFDTGCVRPNITAGQATAARENVRTPRSYLLQ
jgi:hypothetical protein